jgi:hypothetical protein
MVGSTHQTQGRGSAVVSLNILLDDEYVDISTNGICWQTLAELIMVEAGQDSRETPVNLPRQVDTVPSPTQNTAIIDV